jgi:hypothetical protein
VVVNDLHIERMIVGDDCETVKAGELPYRLVICTTQAYPVYMFSAGERLCKQIDQTGRKVLSNSSFTRSQLAGAAHDRLRTRDKPERLRW